MMNSDLPEEILIDIFSRLPTKSVGKFRCLAKTWRSLLSTPQFIKSHLNRKPHQENLILVTPSFSISSIDTTEDDAVSRKLELPINCSQVVGSCDGLVLLVNEEHEKFLVNPITLQQVKIPDSPLVLKKEVIFSYGFGYDRYSDDYKIVALSDYDPDQENELECVNTVVDVYSVKRGVWKRVDSSPYDHGVPGFSSGAFVNGAIHWLASSHEWGYPIVIAAFVLADEVFVKIPAPSGVNVTNFVFHGLVVLGGCLCVIGNQTNRRADIWMMKEYGVGESWTKYSVDASDYWLDILKPLGFIRDDKVVLLTEEGSLVFCNLKGGMLRDMVVDGVPAMFIDGGACVESLVSPAMNGT